MTLVSRKLLDLRGKTITTYIVFDVVTALTDVAEGEMLELVTDDFEPIWLDMAAWAEATGHRLVSSARTADGYRFLIEKRPVVATEKALAMVISNDGLEELLSPLGFALAAALEGMAVHLYFQGPAVRVLARGFTPKLRGWSRPFSRFAALGLAGAGHIPAVEKLGQLRDLGAKMYVCGPSMEHFKVSPLDLIFDDLPRVEYLTFMRVMADADVHVYA